MPHSLILPFILSSIIILPVRSEFSIKIMKLPSLGRAPSKEPRGALTMSYKCHKFLQLVYETNLMKVFQNLTIIIKFYMALPIMSCEAEKKTPFLKDQ